MKKLFIWIGGISAGVIVILIILMLYAAWDKKEWDDISKKHAITVVNGLNKLSREQLLKYWGTNPPGTPEEREKLYEWAATHGELVRIEKINLANYTSKVAFTGQGITHFYIYDVTTKFTNGPLVFRFWFKVSGDRLVVLNMNINSGA